LAEQVGSQNAFSAETIENTALFLRLGLPSTLIRLENGTFWKRFSVQRKLKTPASRFSEDEKHFSAELSENDDVTKIRRFPSLVPRVLREDTGNEVGDFPARAFLNSNPFSNSLGLVWTDTIRCVFRVMTPFSNFLGITKREL